MGRRVRIARVVIGTGVVLALVARPLFGEVTIDRQPEVVERRTFDPRRPPAAMPPLGAHEAAVTQSQFDCSLKLGYEVEEHKTGNGHCTTVLKVQNVTATLRLRIIVWLPTGARRRLVDH
ncbi:MAG TPA: hypothetical protein VN541_04010, partial [Tepidisphaeraceae bacterium]|nr:hypothetical protein [Tepidisphaeraceae bacterium]